MLKVEKICAIISGRSVQYKCAKGESFNMSFSGHLHADVIGNNTSVNWTYSACSIDVINGSTVVTSMPCPHGYEYTEPKDTSFVSQWDLVCDSEFMSDVSQTLLSLGQLAGAIIFTSLADIYGRKPSYVISHLLLFCVAVGIAFSPNFLVFVILRFFLGAFQQGTGLISNVLLVEILPAARRALPSQVGSYVWVLSLFLLCLCAYVTKDVSWQYTQLLLAGCSVYVMFQWWTVDESIRWLLANNKLKDAEKLLKKAARINKADFKKVAVILQNDHFLMSAINNHIQRPDAGNNDMTEAELVDINSNSNENSACFMTSSAATTDDVRFSAFFRNKNVFSVTAISSYMWFADSLTYYGLLMTSTSLTDDFYLGFFVNVLAELPAAFMFGVLINRIGRKNCISIFHTIGGFSLMISVILANASFAEVIPGKYWIILVISLVGKFAISVGFATLFQYTPELYPTNLRNTGFGISSMAARVGGMVAPYSRTFGRHVPWGPGAVFTCLCLLVPVLIRLLPETHGHELPQTIADMDKWLDKKKTGKEKTERTAEEHI